MPSLVSIVQLLSLLFAGVLAGEEFIVRYGVQPALSRLPDHAHLLARQALVRRLRIVAPAIMLPTVVLAVVAVLVSGTGAGTGAGLAFRVAGLGALVAFLLFSFLGTVPLNIRVDGWDAERPPSDWKSVVARWELIDVFRSSAAILGFALLLVAAAASS